MALDLTKYNVKPVADAPQPGTLDLSKYNVKPATNSMVTGPAKKEAPEVKGGFLGELFTGSTQRFGKTAGEAIAAPENAQKYSDALEQHTSVQSNLIKTIAAKKKLGQDTTRLQDALEEHIRTTPKLEDFTGDVINKSTEKIIGEAAGTALEALSGGALSTGKEAVLSKTLSTIDKVKEGAKVGAIYGSIGAGAGALQDEKTASGVIGDTLKGGVIGGALGGGLGYGGAKAGQALDRYAGRAVGAAERKAGQAGKITGEILQGETDDILRGQRVLSTLDSDGIKTYEQGTRALDEKVKKLSGEQDALLEGDKKLRKLNTLNAQLDLGDGSKALKHNYVQDAFKQLDEFYTKTNDQAAKAKLQAMKAKFSKEGATVKEINDLARQHGGALNGFNANGELASGLTKQAAENTRAGLKSTVRQLYGGEPSKAIDKEIGDTIRVRDLFAKNQEAVNKLKQRIQTRSLGAKAGYLIGKVINTIGLGSPKGIVEALIPRGQGFKVMNALDLEAVLQKNLKMLQKITQQDVSEETMIKSLENFFNGIETKQLPANTTKLPAKPPVLKK